MVKRKFHGLWIAMIIATLPLRSEIFTLEECYELARGNYPLIRQYDLIARTEQYNLANAVKGWLPQINLTGKATYQSDVTQLPFDSDQLSALIPGFNIPTMSKDQYQLQGEISQNIWDGGNIRYNRERIAAQAAADRQQLEADLYNLNDRVNQLYFGCLLQDELIAQNQIRQNDLAVNLERVNAMIRNGVANQSDAESVQVEILNAIQQEIELRALQKSYRDMLSILIGRQITPEDILVVPELPVFANTAVINRPELNAYEARERLAETQERQITAGLMPQVGLFVQGGYGRPGLNFLEDKFKAWYVGGVRFSWNIGRFYTLKNDRRLVGVNRQTIGIQRETFLFNTQMEVSQQQTEIEKMNDLIRSDNEIIRLRNNIKQAAEVKLENGTISVTDLIREINAEDLARQTASTHRIQQLMAVYNMIYTTNAK